ncbi:hypothetical protein [Vibrio phage vB_VneS_J26]
MTLPPIAKEQIIMNIAAITAVKQTLEGMKESNQFMDLPVAWSNSFCTVRELVGEALVSERECPAYTLIDLQQAVDALESFKKDLPKTKNVAPFKVELVKAQINAAITLIKATITNVTNSRKQ